MSVVTALGCGTLIHGTTQTVPMSLIPPTAEVSVYRWSGERIAGPARSPGPLVVPRPKQREPYLIVASAVGHCPRYWLTEVSTTTAGQVSWFIPLYAGFPFAVSVLGAVDDRTGGCCTLSPSSVTVELPEDQQCPE